MISKISAILAAALVLGSAGAALAQTHRHAGWQAPGRTLTIRTREISAMGTKLPPV